MQFVFDEIIEKFLLIVAKCAEVSGVKVFFVGGAVRDNLLNLPVKDVDIIVEGNAVDFVSGLPDCIKIHSIHKDFATVKVEYSNLLFDIASTRTEKYPYSGCLPVIEKIGVSINEDVLRRDFSVNSIYCEFYPENGRIVYKMFDPVSGFNDIKNKTLRVLHSKSYCDDPTRILRGVGFKYRFNFEFSNEDICLINKYFSCIDRSKMSIDRAFSVLRKLLASDFADKIFREIVEKKYYKIFTSDELNIDLDKVFEIKKTLSLDLNDFSIFCCEIIKNNQVVPYEISSKVDIVKTFSKLSAYELAYYYYITCDNNVLNYINLKSIKLCVTGKDLFLLNYSQGKNIGVILRSLYEAKLNNCKQFLSKNDEIQWIKTHFPII